jgi:hypothetical protein
MKHLRYFAFSLTMLSAAAQAEAFTSSQILQDIRSHGAKSAVQTLDHAGRFDTVLSRIASGKADWIRLAPDLAKGTDAGNSTGLSIALAKALPRNPRTVVKVLRDDPVIGADSVCGLPFIEPTPSEVTTYLSKAIPAVISVPKSEQFPQRTACLAALTQAKENAASQKATP